MIFNEVKVCPDSISRLQNNHINATNSLLKCNIQYPVWIVRACPLILDPIILMRLILKDG